MVALARFVAGRVCLVGAPTTIRAQAASRRAERSCDNAVFSATAATWPGAMVQAAAARTTPLRRYGGSSHHRYSNMWPLVRWARRRGLPPLPTSKFGGGRFIFGLG